MPINRRKLFRDAWAYAKAFAAFDHSSPRALFATALRKVWAEAKGAIDRTGVVLTITPGLCVIAIDTAFGWRPRYTHQHAAYNPW